MGKDEPKGSQKCEQGVFGSLVKDSAIPLCDEHFPDAKGKNSWLVAFYKKDSDNVKDVLNRVAIDLGNEPPQKSKQMKLEKKKQRKRIKDLAEKYEFEAVIPKKGLEEKGKEPLLKVGAVCCDCGQTEYEVCKARGAGVRILQPGKQERVMADSTDVDSLVAEDIVKFSLGEFGFVKDYVSAVGTKSELQNEKQSVDDLEKKLEALQAEKQGAIADEDFARAKELKNEIEKLSKDLEKTQNQKRSVDDLEKKLEELQAEKKIAVANEDFARAKELKTEIEKILKKLRKQEL